MKRLARILIPAVLMASAMLSAGQSSASGDNFSDYVPEPAQLSEQRDDADKRREFWDKFRESVTPKENNPREKDSPREVQPREVHPREVQPKEVH